MADYCQNCHGRIWGSAPGGPSYLGILHDTCLQIKVDEGIAYGRRLDQQRAIRESREANEANESKIRKLEDRIRYLEAFLAKKRKV